MELITKLVNLTNEAMQYLKAGTYPIYFADVDDEDFHEIALDLPNTIFTEDFGYDDYAIYGIEKDGDTVILLTYNKESTSVGKMDAAYLDRQDTIYLAQYLHDHLAA